MNQNVVINSAGNADKKHMSKVTLAVTINLASEIVKATLGRAVPNKISMCDVPEIVARVINSNLIG